MRKILSILFLLVAIRAAAQEKICVRDTEGNVIFSEYIWKLGNIGFEYDGDFEKTGEVPTEGVDLGLPSGVKWSPWNLGGSASTDKGVLVGWADITGRVHSTDNKYYPSSTAPIVISNTSYDIVSSQWGNDWRMPKRSDYEELLDKCDWTFVNTDDSLGWLVSGSNGNSIFLPLSGVRNGEDVKDVDVSASYWTGNLNAEDHDKAYALNLSAIESNKPLMSIIDRFMGAAVRPIIGQGKIELLFNVSVEDLTTNSANLMISVNGDFSAVPASGYKMYLRNTEANTGTYEIVLGGLHETGNLKQKLSDLDFLTKYEYTIVATVGEETLAQYDGDFTTLPVYKVGNPVDMGTSVMWSDIDFGANEIAQPGEFFTWGDPSGDGSNPVTTDVYYRDNISGTQYDIVQKYWKDKWVMPTKAQFEELLAVCEGLMQGYVKINGTNRAIYKLTSTKTGKSIHLIYTGYYNENGTYVPEDNGRYWVADKASVSTLSALHLWYRNGTTSVYPTTFTASCRLAIHPVYLGEKTDTGGNEETGDTPGGDNDNPGTGDNPGGDKEEEKFDPPVEQPTAGNAVDLGLSVLWADRNVGAYNDADFGDYFAWADTVPNAGNDFSKANYKWYNPDDKYVLNVPKYEISGTEYDAVTHNWGGEWRMPTRMEMDELLSECTVKWVTKTNSKGLVVHGAEFTKNDKSIFIPAAGYYSSQPNFQDEYLRIWTSKLDDLDRNHFEKKEWAYSLQLSQEALNGGQQLINYVQGEYCYRGIPIRPVKNKKK